MSGKNQFPISWDDSQVDENALALDLNELLNDPLLQSPAGFGLSQDREEQDLNLLLQRLGEQGEEPTAMSDLTTQPLEQDEEQQQDKKPAARVFGDEQDGGQHMSDSTTPPLEQDGSVSVLSAAAAAAVTPDGSLDGAQQEKKTPTKVSGTKHDDGHPTKLPPSKRPKLADGSAYDVLLDYSGNPEPEPKKLFRELALKIKASFGVLPREKTGKLWTNSKKKSVAKELVEEYYKKAQEHAASNGMQLKCEPKILVTAALEEKSADNWKSTTKPYREYRCKIAEPERIYQYIKNLPPPGASKEKPRTLPEVIKQAESKLAKLKYTQALEGEVGAFRNILECFKLLLVKQRRSQAGQHGQLDVEREGEKHAMKTVTKAWEVLRQKAKARMESSSKEENKEGDNDGEEGNKERDNDGEDGNTEGDNDGEEGNKEGDNDREEETKNIDPGSTNQQSHLLFSSDDESEYSSDEESDDDFWNDSCVSSLTGPSSSMSIESESAIQQRKSSDISVPLIPTPVRINKSQQTASHSVPNNITFRYLEEEQEEKKPKAHVSSDLNNNYDGISSCTSGKVFRLEDLEEDSDEDGEDYEEPQERRRRQTSGAAPRKNDQQVNKEVKGPCHRRQVYEPEVKVYVQYRDEDVLCGRGGSCNNHHGNIMYLKAKQKLQPQYSAATTWAKRTEVIQELVDRVHAWGGRFLKKDCNEQRWYEVQNHFARSKAGQALRESELRDKHCVNPDWELQNASDMPRRSKQQSIRK